MNSLTATKLNLFKNNPNREDAIREFWETLRYGRLVVRDIVEGHKPHLDSCLSGGGTNRSWTLEGEVVHYVRRGQEWEQERQRLNPERIFGGEYALSQIPVMLRNLGIESPKFEDIRDMWYDYRSASKPGNRIKTQIHRTTVIVRGTLVSQDQTRNPGSYTFKVAIQEEEYR